MLSRKPATLRFQRVVTQPRWVARAQSSAGAAGAAKPKESPLPYPTRTFIFKGHRTRYYTAGCGSPILLVHGFGASSEHFRQNMGVLAKNHKVYALDLLGFGGSEKPNMEYSMELWRDQVKAFMDEFVQGQPAVLVGNSIGSMVSAMVAAEQPSAVRGLVLLNCVGAMNNKGIVDDWRIILVYPILALIDFLLKSSIARTLFDKFRTKDNIKTVLNSVYGNTESVDDELVDLLHRPSCDEGALDVFVSVITGPPGPKPWQVIPKVQAPMLIMWGDKDTFTPLDSPVANYFRELPQTRPNTQFEVLKDVGHCPHDDRPEEVHARLLPWLKVVEGPGGQASTDAACIEGGIAAQPAAGA